MKIKCRKVQKQYNKITNNMSRRKMFVSKQHVKIDQKLKAVKKLALNITFDMKTKLAKKIFFKIISTENYFLSVINH